MKELSITLGDIAALAALADGIIPADERNAARAWSMRGRALPSACGEVRRPTYTSTVCGRRTSSRVSGSAKTFAS